MRIIILISTFIFLLGCIRPIEDFDIAHDPLLQVDATFFTGERLSPIKVRQTFVAPDFSSFRVNPDEVYISGATVTLTWNGVEIEVSEDSMGHYIPQSESIVRPGDRFEIVVQKDNRIVHAETAAPDFPVNDIELRVSNDDTLVVSPNLLIPVDPMTDSLNVWDGELEVLMEIPFVADYTAVDLIASSFDSLRSQYLIDDTFQGISNFTYEEYFGSNLQSLDEILVPRDLRIFLPETDLTGLAQFSVNTTIILPDPVYADYASVSEGLVLPNLVTNVENGVGLFIAAQRVEKRFLMEVEVKTLNN